MRRLLLFVPFLLVGCRYRDADILAEIGRKAGDRLEANFGVSPEVMASRLRGPLEETGLASRVRLRIQFDRYVQDTEVEVGTPSDGVVRLRATVPDISTRQRILDLTRATTGVDRVIDEMKLAGE